LITITWKDSGLNFRLRPLIFLVILAFGLIGLAACSENAQNDPPPKPETIQAFKAEPATNAGDATRGLQVFGRMPCLTCHTLAGSGESKGIAPNLDNIGVNASTRLPGVNAAQYLRHAVTNPQDLGIPNYHNVMPSFSPSLNQTELEDLVAYLLTLR
jgi:mono/diheme cytochrome c family protein